ncbi:uncharacterized protein LOC111446808 [Cucurbita moschata]|uniref:Uncharacterized protein LOC111446808 n=1 Tax=Cucurbita moschata TaxID=3662 RepID=A0A6J1FTY2_CUCMO|nr:uncharacterized protein LOC111446808 [Cucurbita moschata]
MAGFSPVAAAVASVVVLALLLTGLHFWRRRRLLIQSQSVETLQSVENSLQQSGSGTVKLHRQSESDAKRRLSNFYPSGVSQKRLFSWNDNPSLVNDAVENGWTQFAFTVSISSSPSSRSRLLGLFAAGETEKEIPAPEISWEVSQGSADFMQKIRLNSGFKKAINNTVYPSSPPSSVIRTALPLPGPPLASFPQEAYFEITILNISGEEIEPIGTAKEGKRIKLIPENYNSKTSSESVTYFTSNNRVSNVEESKLNAKDMEDEAEEDAMLSIGLTSGESTASKFPGSYPGSIGFNSNGSVYLDGIKLVFESEKAEWGRAEKVIGCGFDPKQKKVFFTVDSEVVHVIHCKSEEFGSPMCLSLAGNADVTVLVNLGQSVFKYVAAQRTPNPCFVSPLVNVGGGCRGNGYEDSRELFSMGMIDSQWFNRASPKPTNNLVVDHREDDELSDEIELFEIVVEDEQVKRFPRF